MRYILKNKEGKFYGLSDPEHPDYDGRNPYRGRWKNADAMVLVEHEVYRVLAAFPEMSIQVIEV